MGTPATALVLPRWRLTDKHWAFVVLWFAALNLLDLGLTLHLVNQSAVELNPIMRALLDAGWEWAALLKIVTTVGVSAGLWFGRRHLLVRRTGFAFVMLFGILITYQVVDVWTTL